MRMIVQEFLKESQQRATYINSSRGRLLRNAAFVLGSAVGAYVGMELNKAVTYFPQNAFSYTVLQHPNLTLMASTALGGVIARGFAGGLQELVARPQAVLKTMRDEMYGRRNGH
ncbi:MAG: hypothetical protein FJY98_01760 [Candidatus Liptonbacteria bacterium]|nr:hypothetical protein [Candidatus Pacearchaeota archaeon]MBM3257034.1 hypothetical protein [Candidatus Liptonbacteria bacterium]